MRCELDKVFIRKSGLAQKESEGGIIIYDKDEAEILALNAVGAEIWNNISLPNSMRDIIDNISASFKAGAERVRKDALSFIRQLKSLGLIEEYSKDLARDRLDEAYAQIPEVSCNRCLKCCASTVITSLEFENISEYFEQNFPTELKEKLEAKFTLNVATQSRQREIIRRDNIKHMLPWEVCAFLDEEKGSCRIYQRRPFACRIFGLEDESRCFTKDIRFPEGAIKGFGSGDIDTLRRDIEHFSPYYLLEEENGSFMFNKSEISVWFHYKNRIKPYIKKDGP